MHDRDIEIHEMHNRIKKLLLEEQRTIKKIDDTRKRASIMLESTRQSNSRRREIHPSFKKDSFEQELVRASIAEIRYNREVSPKEAAARVF